jgi:hypothetical protein
LPHRELFHLKGDVLNDTAPFNRERNHLSRLQIGDVLPKMRGICHGLAIDGGNYVSCTKIG